MQRLLASFTAHFFEGADAAVQEYVAGVLKEAAGDGSAAADVSSSIEAFRSPGIPQSTFEQAVAEVLAGLSGPGSPWPPSWETLAAASELASESDGNAQLPPVTGCSHPSDCASAPAAVEAATASKIGLSIHAPSFQPSSSGSNAAAAAAAALGGLSLSGQHQGAAAAAGNPSWAGGGGLEGEEAATGWDGGPDGPDGCEDGGCWEAGQPGHSWYGENEGGWGTAEPPQWAAVQQQHQHGQLHGGPYSPGSGPAGGWEQQRQGQQGQPRRLVAGSAEQSAFLSVLSQQFPEYSPASLAALLEQQGGSLEATVEVLCSLESELQGQAALGAGLGPGGLGPPPQRERQQAAPAFGDGDFPSLNPAGSTPPTSPTPTPSALTSMPYAAAAKAGGASPAAAAKQPHPRPSSSSAQRAADAGTGAGPSARAPIWEAQGVPQFATGASVAAEYAAAREEARDHARLRNQYFQQATRAYLAGQRQLARELGIKGRWHGQQMRAAHSAASDRIFAQRNQGLAAAAAAAGPAAARPGSASSRQQQRPGAEVLTIDLHGLHVSEALERLESTLLGLPQQASSAPAAGKVWGSPAGRPPPSRRLRVVVGVGQHGKVPSRLPQAVRRYLQDQGMAVTEPHDGLLEVVLP